MRRISLLFSVSAIAALAFIPVKAAWAQEKCGNVTYVGCCLNATTSQYCSSRGTTSEKLNQNNCTGEKPKCGWNASSGYYTCVAESAPDTDPDGAVRDCASLPEPTPCGNIPTKGCCEDDTTEKYCKDGVLISKKCDTAGTKPKCNWSTSGNHYDCLAATETSVDPSGLYPRYCKDIPDGGIKVPDGGVKADTGTSVPCGDIPEEGCCEGEVVKYCSKNSLVTKDCASSLKCGWSSTKSYYTCGTEGTADPSNKFPMNCSAYASSSADASGGTNTDGSSTTITDDSGTTTTKNDAGTTTTKKTEDDGCSCAIGAKPAQVSLMLLVMVAAGILIFSRRRS